MKNERNAYDIKKLKAINYHIGEAIDCFTIEDSLDALEGMIFFSNELNKLLHRMSSSQKVKQIETKETI